MDRKEIKDLLHEYLFRIPDYQRGYAWGEKQLKDFIEDIDALAEDTERVSGHYTGTVVVFGERHGEKQRYGTHKLPVVDVVDGQQRLTTVSLYLSVILRELVKRGEDSYERKIQDYLYSGETSRLTLANASNGIFVDLLKSGLSRTEPSTPHERRLVKACERLQSHIDSKLAAGSDIEYLRQLFEAITQKLHFTFYRIEEAHEVGMTFELMNSRGKDLTDLEKLKNYLMYWVSRNEPNGRNSADLTRKINKAWADVYANLGALEGDAPEGQCLRIAWIRYCQHAPKYWKGYDGFKDDAYIPLRKFTKKRTRANVAAFIQKFVDGLAEISRYFALTSDPEADSKLSKDERAWLEKLHRAGNIANFLPLMVAARRKRESGKVSEALYLAHLKALECFAYRVYQYSSLRSDAGRPQFFRMAQELFNGKTTLKEITAEVHALTHMYSPDHDFESELADVDNWYAPKYRRCLKYTLYEYEIHLLKGKKQPALRWDDLTDSTIEHILPQTPEQGSRWLKKWKERQIEGYLHDIGNLVLTKDNSSYKNFEFARKKGSAGEGPSYANSDFRQERALAKYADWTPREFNQRRSELVKWMKERWKTKRPKLKLIDLTLAASSVDEEE